MKTVISAMALVAFAGVANAQQLLWDFNSQPSDNATGTGTLLPIIGTGTISLIGGTTSSFASGNATGTGSSDPEIANDSELSVSTWAAQGAGSGSRGVEFAFSTLNYSGNVFEFDARFSNSMSKFVEVLVSVNGGSSFSSLGVITGLGDTRFNNQSFALGAAADNQADVRVRVVSIFAPSTSAYTTAGGAAYATTGTFRVDMVSVEGTLVPTPGAAALVGLGGLVIARRRR